MSKKKSSLEDFLDKYLENRSLYEGADSYESYVAKNSKNPKSTYKSAVQNLSLERELERTGYGKLAESLASSGLSGGGYEEYLKGKNEESYRRELDSLEHTMRAEEDLLLGKYTDYLDKYKSSQDRLSKSIGDKITSAGILSEERAYDYARESGLSDSRARSVAKSASKRASENLLGKIIEKIPYMQLDAEGARLLALSLGLNEEYAKRAEDYADRIRGHYDISGTSYLKELINLSNKL